MVTLYFDFAPSRDVAVVLFEGHSKSMTTRAVGDKKYIIRLRRGNSSLKARKAGKGSGSRGIAGHTISPHNSDLFSLLLLQTMQNC